MILGGVTVNSGVTLTINPGTVVKFAGTNAQLIINGTLQVDGTTINRAHFTSYQDDSVGGDTNGDGSATIPKAGDWKHIQINSGSVGNFKYADVRYAGGYSGGGSGAGVFNNGGALDFDNVSISSNFQYGLSQASGFSIVKNSTFSNNKTPGQQTAGVRATSGILYLTNNTFTSNGYAVDVAGALSFVHSGNVATGGLINAIVISGAISSNQTWNLDSLPYVANGLTINSGKTLTIGPGVVVKVGNTPGPLIVNGMLAVNGTSADKAYFISLSDDTVGGDTNGDGVATLPTSGNWEHIKFNLGSSGNFANTIIRYGGSRFTFPYSDAGVFNSGGALNLVDSQIANNRIYGINQSSGSLSITHSEINNQPNGINITGGTANITQSSIHDNAQYGVYNSSANNASAQNNWWGSTAGPYHPTLNSTGTTTSRVSNGVNFIPWMTSDPFVEPTCTENCNSNVMFLPGLEASRLYRPDYNGGTDQLWEPNTNDDAEDLFLDGTGKSIRNDIYTKDVIDQVYQGGPNIYKSFISQMNDLKTDSAIADYGIAPYDWRLSLDDILNYGSQTLDGRIYYSGGLAATSSPFIIQELKRLVASSRTGKVTIVAHSNGGLVAKALVQKLGDMEAAKLIDKIIFVAVPQTGTPQAIGALLHGFKQGIPEAIPLILEEETARTLAEDMPSAYNLLPSEKYFSDVQTPVVTFDNFPILTDAFTRYGTFLNTPAELHSFLLGEEGRAKPVQNDLDTPNVLNGVLLENSEITRQNLDNWLPPIGIEAVQIAGWGIDTLKSIEYYQKGNSIIGYSWAYNPKLTEDGDSTVVAPSALAMSTNSPNVKRYWVNLKKINRGLTIDREHRDILEILELRTFIQNIITQKQDQLPQYILTSTPTPNDSEKKLRFFMHSPLTLNLYDDQGRHTGISATGTVDREIPGTDYREFGEVKYVSTTASTTRLEMNGLATGTFTLNIEAVSGGQVATSTTFVDIPVATSTIVTMDIISPNLSDVSNLYIDSDGDGATDFQLKPGGTVSDTTAPTTTVSTIGTLGKNGWHTSDVNITLSAEDNEGGVGVKSTEYSLDNGLTWNTYSTTTPITFSTEGMYTILYFSTDFFNNKENVTSMTIKIDKTPPEAKITLDPLTQKLNILGTDNLSTTTVLITATTATITDEAGNTLEFAFSKLKQEKKEIKAEIQELRYNSVSTGEIPKTVLQYEWSTNKAGNIKELEEKATINRAKTEGHYDAKKNVTRIKTESNDGNKKKNQETLPGLVIINLVTDKGKIKVNY